MRLPDHVFATVQRVAAKYPGRVSDETLAKALNEIAWTHREEGYGLSRKEGGRHIVHPTLGAIAEDILQLPDGTHWDIFLSAGHGNPLDPHQGESIVPNTPRPWVAPVAPTGEVIIPPPPVPPPPSYVGCQCKVEEAIKGLATSREVEGASTALYELIANILIAEHVEDVKSKLGKIEAQVAAISEQVEKMAKSRLFRYF